MAASLSITRRRTALDLIWRAISAVCALGVSAILIMIIGYIIERGFGALSLSFLIHLPHPVGIPGGGVFNGIVGSFIICGIAALMAFPVGILVGIYLSTNRHARGAQTLSFIADVLAGVPSIAIGIFAYTLLVEPFRHFSAFSASFAFAVLMLPLVMRATEGAISLVPAELKEATVALGASEYRAMIGCLLVAARPGIITGLLLALARVTGETAPLLFTAFGSQFWEVNPTNPMAELSLQVFNYAISPYDEWHQQAWAGALLLVLAVFLFSMAARLSLRKRQKAG